MEQEFNPPNPTPGNSLTSRYSLPFQARSVSVDSGPNFVTILPSGQVVGPGYSGATLILDPATPIASFMLTAPPAGVAPVGPTQLQATGLSFSDTQTEASPGTKTAPPQQPVTLIQTLSTHGIPPPVHDELSFSTALARAVTFFAYALDGNTHNWDLVLITLGGRALDVFLGTSKFVMVAGGEGTNGGTVGIGITSPMAQNYTLKMQGSGGFSFDGRLYF